MKFGRTTPYDQSNDLDLWLPVRMFGVGLLVKLIPLIAVSMEAVLIGRMFGPLALLIVSAALYVNRTLPEGKRVETLWPMLAAIAACVLWLFDAWPADAVGLEYVFHFSTDESNAILTQFRPFILWKVGRRALEPMGVWLFFRIFLIYALPYALPEAWGALDWRIITEIVAPSYANSIVAPKGKPAETPAPVRADSTPLTGGGIGNVFADE